MCAEEDSSKVYESNVATLSVTSRDILDGVPVSMAVRPTFLLALSLLCDCFLVPGCSSVRF